MRHEENSDLKDSLAYVFDNLESIAWEGYKQGLIKQVPMDTSRHYLHCKAGIWQFTMEFTINYSSLDEPVFQYFVITDIEKLIFL